MKKKVVIILAIVLVVFGLSFYVGKKLLAGRENNVKDENTQNEVVEKNLENNTPVENDNSDNDEKEDGLDDKEENTNTTNDKDKNVTSKESTSNNTTTTNKDSKQSTSKNTTSSSKNTTTSKNTTSSSSKDTSNKTSSNTTSKDTSTNNKTTDSKNAEKTVVKKEEDVEELELQYEKYGTKFYTARYYNIYTYSDGTTNKELHYTVSTKMDISGFNGTAASMMEEAKKVVNENMSIYEDLLEIVNGYRKEVGSEPLTLDYNLTIAATIRAMEMAYTNDLEHQRPNGQDCFDIFKELGVSQTHISGENIAAGAGSAKGVAQLWRDSTDGHYENMINASYKKVGLGMYQLKGTRYNIYWAQMFTA